MIAVKVSVSKPEIDASARTVICSYSPLTDAYALDVPPRYTVVAFFHANFLPSTPLIACWLASSANIATRNDNAAFYYIPNRWVSIPLPGIFFSSTISDMWITGDL